MIEILFNDFKLKVIKEELQQFDNKTVDIIFEGNFSDEYTYKMYLSHKNNLDLIVLTKTNNGNYKTTLTETQLAFAGLYNIQLLAIDKNDNTKKKHSNIVTFNCLESMSGDTHWVTIPTEFSQFETRLLGYISSVASELIVHAEIDVNGHLIFTFADGSTADIGTVMIDVSSKQDKTDNSLETTNKTVVGAINGLNTGKADKVNVTSADVGKFMRVNSRGEWGAETVPNANGVNF